MTEAARPVINLVSGTYYDNVDFDTPEVRAHMVCGEGETLLVSNPSLGSSGVWAIFPHGDASGTRLVDGLITDWNGKVWGTRLGRAYTHPRCAWRVWQTGGPYAL